MWRIANRAGPADHPAMPHETIEVRKVTPAIGAEISGIDLAAPLSNRQVSELHDALDQEITALEELAGELQPPPEEASPPASAQSQRQSK